MVRRVRRVVPSRVAGVRIGRINHGSVSVGTVDPIRDGERGEPTGDDGRQDGTRCDDDANRGPVAAMGFGRERRNHQGSEKSEGSEKWFESHDDLHLR